MEKRLSNRFQHPLFLNAGAIRNPQSAIPNPQSEIKNPKSNIRNPTSKALSPDVIKFTMVVDGSARRFITQCKLQRFMCAMFADIVFQVVKQAGLNHSVGSKS